MTPVVRSAAANSSRLLIGRSFAGHSDGTCNGRSKNSADLFDKVLRRLDGSIYSAPTCVKLSFGKFDQGSPDALIRKRCLASHLPFLEFDIRLTRVWVPGRRHTRMGQFPSAKNPDGCVCDSNPDVGSGE